MHQTFYIDVDEEITSIIEKIKGSRMDELVVVVPKGALLIQSIINLKLLKKEADSLNKEIIIVTQDKAGKLLIEKAGIAIENKLEDVEGERWENVSEEKIAKEKPYISDEKDEDDKETIKKRLDKIGSPEFFEENGGIDFPVSEGPARKKKIAIHSKNNSIDNLSEGDERILNKELVVDLGKEIKKDKVKKAKNSSMDLVKSSKVEEREEGNESFFEEKRYPGAKEMAKNLFKENQPRNISKRKETYQEKSIKDEKFEQFLNGGESILNRYKAPEVEKKRYTNPSQNIKLPSKFWKIFITLSLLVGVFALSLFLYLFLPKAKVTVFLKTKSQSVDAEIKGSTKNVSVDSSNEAIPAKAISFVDEISKSFSSTGEKSASSRKARGTITIYNEYSSASQPLVATTRFLSSEGKLFRLVSGTVIPGMTKVGTEMKPGAVEAEVVADEAGDSFNISAATFTIPGFQGSGNEKYSKFYAKSFSAMTGGGSGETVANAVTEQDINSAKEKVLTEFNASINQKIKDKIGEGYLVLDDSFNVSENNYKISNSVGDVVDEFTVTMSAKIDSVVFSEEDLRDVVYDIMNKNQESGLKISKKTIEFDFGKSDSNLAEGTILIRVHAKSKMESSVDANNLKKGILGKTQEELKAYLSTYGEFSNVEVEYWPAFLGEKIPIYESRTEVVLDNN